MNVTGPCWHHFIMCQLIRAQLSCFTKECSIYVYGLTSLLVTLSHDRIWFHVDSVHTVVNIPLFIRNPYMFLMTSRYTESLFIGTFVYGRSIQITHRNAEIRMLNGEWGHS